MIDAKGINDGTIRAVSNEERLENLLELARQHQTDISPNNWTPQKLACVTIDTLRADLRFANLRIESLEVAEDDYTAALMERDEEIALLRRPLWVKIVAWFARHGS